MHITLVIKAWKKKNPFYNTKKQIITSILKNSLELWLWSIFSENSLDTFLLVFYKHFVYNRGTWF